VGESILDYRILVLPVYNLVSGEVQVKFGLILFAITIVLYPASQILWKLGMNQIGGIGNTGQLLHTVLKMVANPYIIVGTFLAVINLIIWLGAISTLKLSYLYPFGSISYLTVTALAYFVLKENITPYQWAGICVIVIGCYLINK